MDVLAIQIQTRRLSGGVLVRTHYISDVEYRDPTTGQEYRPVLEGSIILERGNDDLRSPFGVSTVSDITILNDDAFYSAYLQTDVWKGESVEVFYGDTSQAVASMQSLGKLQIAEHPTDNGRTITVAMRDLMGELSTVPLNDQFISSIYDSGGQEEPLILGRSGFTSLYPLAEGEASSTKVRRKNIRYRFISELVAEQSGPTIGLLKQIYVNGRPLIDSGGDVDLDPRGVRAAVAQTFVGVDDGEIQLYQRTFEDIDGSSNTGFYKCATNDCTGYPLYDNFGITSITWGTSGSGYLIAAGDNWTGATFTPPNYRFVIFPTVYEAMTNGMAFNDGNFFTGTFNGTPTRDDYVIYNDELLSQGLRCDVFGLMSSRDWADSPLASRDGQSFCDLIYMLYSIFNDNYDDDYVLTTFEENMLKDIRLHNNHFGGCNLVNQESFTQAISQILSLGYLVTLSKDGDLLIYWVRDPADVTATEHTIEFGQIIDVRVHTYYPRLWKGIYKNKQNHPPITSAFVPTSGNKKGTTGQEWVAHSREYQIHARKNYTRLYKDQDILNVTGTLADNSVYAGPGNSEALIESLTEPYENDLVIYELSLIGIPDYEIAEKVKFVWPQFDITNSNEFIIIKITVDIEANTTTLLVYGVAP